MTGELSPGDRITTIKEDVQKSGVSRRHSGCVSLGESRMDVRGGLEQGEHFKKPLESHPGKTARNPLDLSTAQKQHEEARSKKEEEKCQKRRQNPCDECGKNSERCSVGFKHQCTHSKETLYKCPDCAKCFKCHQRIHTGERPYSCPQCPQSF
ncbi:hypothetical protein CIB84_017139, partial [Bambusicola thoracicus]